MTVLIQHGTVVTALDAYRADVRIEEGIISEIGQHLTPRAGEELVDASSRYILPGGIDVHTHIDMPFMGSCSTDDFYTGTVAAAFGGTTSVIDFIVPVKGRPLQEALETWRGKAARSVIDYGFHMCLVEFTDKTTQELEAMVAQGITSFKLFTAYPGALMIDDGAIFKTLKWAASANALIQVHAENGPAIAAIVEGLVAEGKTDPLYHGLSRPSRLEGEATARTIDLAAVAGAPLYVVHLTCAEALEAVAKARKRGQAVYAETCPQYLYCSLEDLARPNFEGAKYVCSPPLREKSHQGVLWRGLSRGDLQTVATDHCPFHFHGMKEMGRQDFRKIPNGMPGIEHRLYLMYQGVVDGRISLSRFVDLVSTAPARLFGLYPRKGAIVPGADADVVIWDPRREVDLSHAHQHMRVDYSPYEGMKVKGGPEKVFLRGKLLVDGDRCVGQEGQGQYLPRARFSAPV